MSDERFEVRKDIHGGAWVSLDSLHSALDGIIKRAENIPFEEHERFARMSSVPGVLIRAVAQALLKNLPDGWATDPRRKDVATVTFKNGVRKEATARRRRVIQGPETGNDTATTEA